MKRMFFAAFTVALASAMQLFIVSCESEVSPASGEGELRLSFESVPLSGLRTLTDVPDTSEFQLTVTASDGKLIYDGKYGDCPESLKVAAGSYTVTVCSSDFLKPAFDSPQYGDSQCVVVEKNGIVNVGLICRQLNSGIRLLISSAFLTAYPDGVLFLKSAEGRLMYSYSEKRVAFFNPGPVSVILNSGGKDDVLVTRELQSQEVLVLGISVSGKADTGKDSGIRVAVDTSRVWIEDSYVIGGGNGGSSSQSAVSVAQARSMAPASDVWVSGYIVGGDLTSASGSFEEPFKSRTNLILGPRSSTTDRSVCIAVQLQSGTLRDKLNLVDNPTLLGRKVCLRGNLVTDYFNLTGLKNLTDAEL